MTRRLFIACPVRGRFIDQELLSTWKAVGGPHGGGLFPEGSYPEREGQPHITLRFLGDVDVENSREGLRRLLDDLDEITGNLTRIPLVLGPLGIFQGVLWCGIGGTNDAMDQFNALQVKVDGAVKLRGWPDADYPFLPHITIGRYNRTAEVNIEDLKNYQSHPQPYDFEIGSVELMESVRTRDILDRPTVQYHAVCPPFLFSDVRR